MGRCKHYRSPSHRYRSTRRLITHLHIMINKRIPNHSYQEVSHPPSLWITDKSEEETDSSESMIENNIDTINSSKHVEIQTMHSFYTSTPKAARNTCVWCRRKLFMESCRPPDKPHSGLQQAVLQGKVHLYISVLSIILLLCQLYYVMTVLK